MEIDRFGVGLFSSCFSASAPNELLELFFIRLGDAEDRWFKLVALEARRRVCCCGFGECGCKGEVAACEGRRVEGECRFGVAGAEDMGVLIALLEVRRFETLLAIVWPACACSTLSPSLRGDAVCVSIVGSNSVVVSVRIHAMQARRASCDEEIVLYRCQNSDAR